jgi:hypothetical protein
VACELLAELNNLLPQAKPKNWKKGQFAYQMLSNSSKLVAIGKKLESLRDHLSSCATILLKAAAQVNHHDAKIGIAAIQEDIRIVIAELENSKKTNRLADQKNYSLAPNLNQYVRPKYF